MIARMVLSVLMTHRMLMMMTLSVQDLPLSLAVPASLVQVTLVPVQKPKTVSDVTTPTPEAVGGNMSAARE